MFAIRKTYKLFHDVRWAQNPCKIVSVAPGATSSAGLNLPLSADSVKLAHRSAIDWGFTSLERKSKGLSYPRLNAETAIFKFIRSSYFLVIDGRITSSCLCPFVLGSYLITSETKQLRPTVIQSIRMRADLPVFNVIKGCTCTPSHAFHRQTHYEIEVDITKTDYQRANI